MAGSAIGRPRARSRRGAYELADRAGEGVWRVAYDECVAVGDFDEMRVRQDAGEPTAVVGVLDAVFGRPDHQHWAVEFWQPRAYLQHLAPAGSARIPGQVAPDAPVGLQRPEPAGDQGLG